MIVYTYRADIMAEDEDEVDSIFFFVNGNKVHSHFHMHVWLLPSLLEGYIEFS